MKNNAEAVKDQAPKPPAPKAKASKAKRQATPKVEKAAKELKAAFKLSEDQAVKIVRRITGRARFFQRAFSFVTVK